MKDNKINSLLDRYFAGETSLEEERQLRAFFRQEDLPEQWLPYRSVFRNIEQQAVITLPATVEKEILEKIARSASPKIRRMRWRLVLPYAAAVAVLLIGIGWWSGTLPEKEATAGIDWSKYEPETPEEAARVYQQAMLQLSTALNKGASTAAKNVQRVETVGQFFE